MVVSGHLCTCCLLQGNLWGYPVGMPADLRTAHPLPHFLPTPDSAVPLILRNQELRQCLRLLLLNQQTGQSQPARRGEVLH